MINYFYNITIKSDEMDFYSDVLTSVRKDFYLSREKQKGKLTQNSNLDTVFYEFSIERDRTMKWLVSADDLICSDVKTLEGSKYAVNYYNETGLCKRLIFSKLHTLLRVEYFNMLTSGSAYCSIEPRKTDSGLCLVLYNRGVCVPVILYPMPTVEDEYILDKIEDEFTDYSAIASTNDGVVRFLSQGQLELFEAFVDRAQALKLTETAPASFIDEEDAVLASKLNPKDFNLKRNLSQVIDITQAEEFSYDIEDILLGELSEKTVENESDNISNSYSDKVEETIKDECTAEVNNPEVQAPDLVVYEPEVIDEPVVEEIIEEIVQVSQKAPVDECDIEETTEINEEFDFVAETQVVQESQNVSEEPECVIETSDCINEDDFEDDFVYAQPAPPDKIIEVGTNRYLYFGELDENGVRNGFGRTAIDNGYTAYEGNYLNNKRCGKGAYYYKDGTLCYYGDWKDNKRDGFGVGVSSFDNSVHIGQFKNNKPQGDGARVDSEGNVKFVTKTLSNGIKVVLKFEGDRIEVLKYNESGELISENTSNLNYF